MLLINDLQRPAAIARDDGRAADLHLEPMIDDTAFAVCMAPFEPFEDRPFLAVAVSGGPDSFALTLLADRWANRRGGRVVGLTVDHGLRPGSADDAERTGLLLKTGAIEHHVLPWRGNKPRTGLQQRAREARYALLAAWCRQHRCLHLLVAHHLQDQAETVAIRKARKSGRTGLAGMASIRELQGLRLLRPLLGIQKTALIHHLEARAQPWVDDPSNHSAAFTRNRLRNTGLDVRALVDEAERQGARRQENDRQLSAALVRHTTLDPAGFAWLDAAGFDRLPPDLAQDLLSRLLVTIGGRVYPPRSRSLSRLFGAMWGKAGDPAPTMAPATLAHCRILRRHQRWLVCREPVSSETVALQFGRTQRFDDRFHITLAMPISGLMVGALGARAGHGRAMLMQKEKTRQLPGAVKLTLPAIFEDRREDRRLIAIPHLGLYDEPLAPQALRLCFCPHTPLANAPFMPHIPACSACKPLHGSSVSLC